MKQTLFTPRIQPSVGNMIKNSIGFDKIFDMLNDSMNDINACTYPPYNIIKVAEGQFVIEMALAGFNREELSVAIDGDSLIIAGETRRDEPNGFEYIHRGIAQRQFERKFRLSELVEVTGVTFKDGMLIVRMAKRPENEKKVVKVSID